MGVLGKAFLLTAVMIEGDSQFLEAVETLGQQRGARLQAIEGI